MIKISLFTNLYCKKYYLYFEHHSLSLRLIFIAFYTVGRTIYFLDLFYENILFLLFLYISFSKIRVPFVFRLILL